MTKINRLTLAALALLLSGCVRMPLPTTPDETAAPVVYEARVAGESLVLAGLPGQWVSVSTEGVVVEFRLASEKAFRKTATPPPSPALACPCPEFVLSMGGVLVQGQDPDEPPPCTVATNCGRHLPVAAETLPGCQREARERVGGEG